MELTNSDCVNPVVRSAMANRILGYVWGFFLYSFMIVDSYPMKIRIFYIKNAKQIIL